MRTQDPSTPSRAAPCLTCGYDLRARLRPGAGSIKCTECGAENDLRWLTRQGWTIRNRIMVALVVVGPPAVLLASAWVFLRWSLQSVHVSLTLVLAPAVVIAHAYVAWQAAANLVTLRRGLMRWTKWSAMIASIAADLIALFVTIRWGWS